MPRSRPESPLGATVRVASGWSARKSTRRPSSVDPRSAGGGSAGAAGAIARRATTRRRDLTRRGSLVAPDGCFAVTAVHQVAAGVLRPLRAAGASLAPTIERTRETARGGARLLAVLRGDPDGVVAALTLALVHPPRIAPARVLGGLDSG